MQTTIQYSTVYDHPISAVWKAISDAEALGTWLMPNDFKPIVGHQFTFRTKAYPGFDGITRCTVLAVEEPHYLAFSWSGGSLENSQVSFRLTAEDNSKTRLDFEHSGFDGFINKVIVRRILARGWQSKILKIQLPKYLSR